MNIKKEESAMEETRNTMPLIGEKAPSFKAVTTQGEINFPEDFAGKWLFYFLTLRTLPRFVPPSS
jgi:peroxiredoxin (alkyl hydroperoxide reductase subunit C)